MPGDTCDRTCACSHTCKISSTNQKSPVPASLSSVQSYMPNRNFVVATATLVAVTFCFHNSSLSCFVLNETFDMLQEQETLYFIYRNLRSHVQFQITKSNRSSKRGCTCELTLVHQFLPGMNLIIIIIIIIISYLSTKPYQPLLNNNINKNLDAFAYNQGNRKHSKSGGHMHSGARSQAKTGTM